MGLYKNSYVRFLVVTFHFLTTLYVSGTKKFDSVLQSVEYALKSDRPKRETTHVKVAKAK